MSISWAVYNSLSSLSHSAYDSYLDSLTRNGSEHPLTVKLRQKWLDFSEARDIVFDIYASSFDEEA